MLRWLFTLPFRFLFSVLRYLTATPFKKSLTAEEAVSRYVTEFEKRHGTSHVPLSSATYKVAVEKARADLRFLLVMLTSEVHDDTPAMEKLMCDDILRAYILDNDISVWAGDVTTPEAYAVSSALGAGRFPFVALILYQSSAERSGMSCVSKLEGLPDVVELMSCLEQAIEKFGPTLISLRADRQAHTFAREIRAEQDSAYETSLRKDRERADREREEQAETRRRETKARELEADKQAWRAWQRSRVASLQEPSATSGISKISFRMPSGSRLIRKFAPDTKLSDVYDWIDIQLHLDENPGTSNELLTERPVGYVHEYDFTLAAPLPRQVLEASDQELKEIKAVYPSGSLIVEKIE